MLLVVAVSAMFVVFVVAFAVLLVSVGRGY
jgi:hypothetical protein